MSSVNVDAVQWRSGQRQTRQPSMDVTMHAVLRVREEFPRLLEGEPADVREQLAHDLDALLERYDHGELADGGNAALHLLSCHDLTRARLLLHLAVLDHEDRHPVPSPSSPW
jgi:hypothetical protein